MLHHIPSDVLDAILEHILDVLYPEWSVNLSETCRHMQRTLAPHIEKMQTLLQRFEKLRHSLVFNDVMHTVGAPESMPHMMRSLMQSWDPPILPRDGSRIVRLCMYNTNPFLSVHDFIDQFFDFFCCRAKPLNL